MRAFGTKVAELLFERRYGLDTTRHVGRETLALGSDEAMPYEPSGWLALRTALPRSKVRPDDVFADLGSGLGRVVFQAALRYPLRRVVGVDRSHELNEVARRNIGRNRSRLRCAEVEIVDADLLEWEIPDDLTIAYIHNSVVGELFDGVVERLLEFTDRRGRALRLIYVNPIERGRLLATCRARQLPLPHTLPALLGRRTSSMIQRFDLVPSTEAPVSSPSGARTLSSLALPLAGELASPVSLAAESFPY